ncbi:MAG: endonuclease/exonuclease/phosphatase family protein [Muribaculaceae bacterium]|nr:endonuclease/exonuclease/phosphatase family protein [Muribaculaceae bacterium]
MKNYIHILLLVLAAMSVSTVCARNNSSGRKYLVAGVAFYNLENLFDTINNNGKYDLEFTPDGSRKWDTKKYRSKIANLARTITSMASASTPNGPAVLGVSEVENCSVLEDLVKEVDCQLVASGRNPWNLRIVHHDSPDRRGIDVACLYNPAIFSYISDELFPLHIDSEPDLKTRDQLCVTGSIGGDTICIIVNHWPSRLGGQERSSHLREAAAQLCKAISQRVWDEHPDRGVIIMGDLNDDPQDTSCAKILGARKNSSSVAVHGFYNPFWSMLDKGIGTLAYNGSWNLFDQIIVSGTLLERFNPDNLHYRSCKVLNFEFLRIQEGDHRGGPFRTYSGGVFLNGYSDHFPTEIFLVKPRTND